MSGIYGADVAQLRTLAQRFDSFASQLDASRQTVGSVVRGTPWVGPDATRFRGEWESEHSRRMADAASLLRDAATRARRNADEQEGASAVDGASGTGGAPSGWAWPFDGGTTPGPAADWAEQYMRNVEYATTHAGEYLRTILDSGRAVTEWDPMRSGWTVGDLGGLLPGDGTGLDVFLGLDKLSDGEIPWHEAVDIAAGAARGSGNPIAYGLGFAAANFADGIDLAVNDVDWSAKGMTDAWNGLWNPDAWKEVGHDMTTKLPKLLVGNVGWW